MLFFPDINNKALTFTSPGAFLKKNYFSSSEEEEEKTLLKSMLIKNILINLRTYDTHSLILYANDHLNNFAHLYISNGTNIVYLFNAGNEIKNITVEYLGANTGISVQIAIVRTDNTTTLHVNEHNVTLDAVPLLLDTYSNKPWLNPEKEILAPQRPPAPPTDYFQVDFFLSIIYSINYKRVLNTTIKKQTNKQTNIKREETCKYVW